MNNIDVGKRLALVDGNIIPTLGFGTFQIPPDDASAAVRTALELGYRNVDTAARYLNEEGVGAGLRESGVERGDIFLATKLANDDQGAQSASLAIADSLSRLRVEYVDLYLVHWPCPARGEFINSWKSMETAQAEGKISSLGVSNFLAHHLEELAAHTTVAPVLNQVECHPYLQQGELREYMRGRGIALQAWSPLAQGKCLHDPVITAIAEEIGRTAAQVVLRWHLQVGNLVIPKSVTRKRQQENADIFDFSLTDGQMKRIAGLDRGEDGRTGFHPDRFNGFPEDFAAAPGDWKIPPKR